MVEDNNKIMSYKSSNSMSIDSSKISIKKGFKLTDSFIVGKDPFISSPEIVIFFPLRRAFRSGESS